MNQNKKMYKFIATVLRPFMKIIFPCEIIGIENVKDLQGGYIICSNHLSNLDPVFFILFHTEPICFMAKSELFQNKLLAWLFSSLGVFSVKRGKGDQEALNCAKNIINDKGILGIFIEGTRSKTGEFLRPKSGTALIANSTHAPVVPVCITGKTSNRKIKIFRKTVIRYGTPIMPEQLKTNENTRHELKFATNLIMNKIKELRI